MTNQKHGQTLFLEVFREGDRIKVSAQEGRILEERTLQYYEEKILDWNRIYKHSGVIFQVMRAFNKDGRLANHSLQELRHLGQLLLDDIFPPELKEQILSSEAPNMIVRVDNGLVQVPWELLYDGDRFFCLRWSMGRVVRTQQRVYTTLPRSLHLPLRMLLIADPRGDLPAAYREGTRIRDLVDVEQDKIEGDLLCHQVTTRVIQDRLKDSDLLHYAGHADYVASRPAESGLLLKDGKITAQEIIQMAGGQGVPSLVFVNGCLSGQTDKWSIQESRSREIFGLANAFLLAGARHYVGTFWEVQDEPSNRFALCFYEELLRGSTVGESLLEARQEIIREFGEAAIVWASYMLYGEPTFAYVKAEEKRLQPESTRPTTTQETLDNGDVRRGTKTSDYTYPSDNQKTSEWGTEIPWAKVVYGILAVVITVGFVYLYLYMREVQEITTLLRETVDEIYFAGDLEEVVRKYETALEGGGASSEQLFELHNRLGRIHSRQGNPEEAVYHYSEAEGLDPENRQVKGNLCMALYRMGRFEEASICFDQALKMDPEDWLALSLHSQLEERLSTEAEQSRKERIQALKARLKEKAEAQGESKTPSVEDAWKSRPLSLVLLSLTERGGLSRRDGETEGLLLRMESRLKEKPRIQIVSRALMETVLDELDLGTGKLADPAFSLRLGEIMSARLIGNGNIYRDKDTMQVNLRLIETETTSLKVALVEIFPRDMPMEEVSDRLTERILKEIEGSYPLRGEVSSVEESGKVLLTIGSQEGLAEGVIFKVLPPRVEDPRLAFARLRVLSVQKSKAEAEMLDHKAPVTEGCRVIESEEPLK